MKKLFILSLLSLSLPFAGFSGFVAAQEKDDQDEKELNTIYITSSSKIAEPTRNAGSSITVLLEEDLEHSRHLPITELLRTTAGITATNAGGAGKATSLRIRGEEGYRTKVIIDGIDISDPTATQIGPNIENIGLGGDIERIEILRGPQGFIYGADAGGVVNIFTAKGSGELKANILSERGRYNTSNFSGNLSAGNETGDFLLSVTDSETDGFNARESDTSKDSDGYQNTTIHGKVGLNFGELARFQWVAREVDAENEYDSCFPSSDDCRNTFDQLIHKLSIDTTLDTFNHHAAYSVTNVTSEFFTDDVSGFKTDGQIKKVEYWLDYKSGVSQYILGVDKETAEAGGNDRYQRGLYFEYKGNFSDKFFFSIGQRLDDNEDFGYYTSERVSAAFIQQVDAGDIKYRSSYGTGFRAPSLYEISYNNNSESAPASDVELTKEVSEGYDIGIEYTHKNGFYIGTTYFNQLIRDEIYFDLDSFSGYLQAKGRNTSKGLETSSVIPVHTNWVLNINHTYNYTRDAEGEQRLRRPKHIANIGVKYFDDVLTSTLNFRGSMDSIDIGNEKLDDYVVADFGVSYKFNQYVGLYGKINNVFDKQYKEIADYKTADRAFYFGTKINL